MAQRLAVGKPIDEIFDGPRLDHGFIDTDELLLRVRKTSLRASDLIREIMDVADVLMVKHLVFSRDGTHWENWWLDLDMKKTPVLDTANSKLSLNRRQIEVVAINQPSLHVESKLSFNLPKPEELDLQAPAGRNR